VDIDFRAKKTNAEWGESWQRFADTWTRLWFDWVGWVLITGALMYLYRQSKSPAVLITVCISFVFFIMYFTSYFNRFTFHGFPFVTSPRLSLVLSVILSVSLSYGLFYLLKAVVFAVASHSGLSP
jgi:hypothetical protein